MNIESRNLLLACNFSERAKERGGSCLVVRLNVATGLLMNPDRVVVIVVGLAAAAE